MDKIKFVPCEGDAIIVLNKPDKEGSCIEIKGKKSAGLGESVIVVMSEDKSVTLLPGESAIFSSVSIGEDEIGNILWGWERTK